MAEQAQKTLRKVVQEEVEEGEDPDKVYLRQAEREEYEESKAKARGRGRGRGRGKGRGKGKGKGKGRGKSSTESNPREEQQAQPKVAPETPADDATSPRQRMSRKRSILKRKHSSKNLKAGQSKQDFQEEMAPAAPAEPAQYTNESGKKRRKRKSQSAAPVIVERIKTEEPPNAEAEEASKDPRVHCC